jgi:hypothetical protein
VTSPQKGKNWTIPTLELKHDLFCGQNTKISDSVFGKFVQSDQKENKSEQALQITDHVVAQFYANKRSVHGRRQFVVSNATL